MNHRIDGYLSRRIIVSYMNGKKNSYDLNIIKPIDIKDNDPQTGTDSRLRIFMSDFKIIPYTFEIPYIIYIDNPILVNELSGGGYEMIL